MNLVRSELARSTRRRAGELLGAALVAAVAGGCAASLPPSAPNPLLGKALPRLSGHTLDGERVDAASSSGRTLVVKFFARYCKPCAQTLPVAEALHRERREVLFLGVALDETRREVDEVVQAYRLSFPIVHDRMNVISGRFRVAELPATFVVDRRGIVRWYGGPGQQEADLERVLDALAAE